MEKTYNELLKYDETSILRRKKEVEFLVDNKTIIFQNMHPDKQDYEIFVGCMEIYKEIGINYFKEYENFMLTIGFLNICDGIKGYLEAYEKRYGCKYYDIRNLPYEYRKNVETVIKIMKFFGFEKFNGLNINQYKELADRADKDLMELRIEVRKTSDELKAIEDENKVKEYFSFNNFDNKKAESEFKKCVKSIGKTNNSKKVNEGRIDYTLDKSIEDETRLNSDEAFIILFYSNGKIISAGYTEFLISYIGNKSKKLEFDSVSYCIVKKEYYKYVYVKILMYFNLKIPNNTITISNEKFTNLNHAKRIYKILYGLNLRSIKKIIETNNLEQYMLSDSFILDKVELDLAVKKYVQEKK